MKYLLSGLSRGIVPFSGKCLLRNSQRGCEAARHHLNPKCAPLTSKRLLIAAPEMVQMFTLLKMASVS